MKRKSREMISRTSNGCRTLGSESRKLCRSSDDVGCRKGGRARRRMDGRGAAGSRIGRAADAPAAAACCDRDASFLQAVCNGLVAWESGRATAWFFPFLAFLLPYASSPMRRTAGTSIGALRHFGPRARASRLAQRLSLIPLASGPPAVVPG